MLVTHFLFSRSSFPPKQWTQNQKTKKLFFPFTSFQFLASFQPFCCPQLHLPCGAPSLIRSASLSPGSLPISVLCPQMPSPSGMIFSPTVLYTKPLGSTINKSWVQGHWPRTTCSSISGNKDKNWEFFLCFPSHFIQ